MPHISAHPHSLLMATASDALWLWNPKTGNTDWGSTWFSLLGLPADAELKPGTEEWQSRLHPDEKERIAHLLDLCLSGETDQFETELRLRTESGDYRWLRAHIRSKHDATGLPLLLAGSFTDISEHKLLDPYTRLPNRIVLLDRMERSLTRLRFGGSHAVGVLSVQIHLPASHADLLNHDEQIQLARILGERITSELRPWDFIAQLDALGYAILLEMVAAGSDIATITDRLFRTLRQPVQIGRHTIQIGASIGSADTASVEGDEEHMLRAAESAAQLAASHGFFHHIAYNPETQHLLSQHLKIEQDIIGALFEQSFEPWFQPIVDLRSGNVTGFEALARWPRNGEILEPRQFLPFMERSGLVGQLTWIMLQKGLEAQQGWIKAGLLPPDSQLGINLPLDQLLDTQLAEQILALIDETDSPASRVRLEVPEKIVLRQSTIARDTLAQLQRSGMVIAIDDTGAGHTSLLQLQNFPLDILKIERSFVRMLEQDPAARGIIRAIVALAGSMDLGVIAKGVETPAQLTFLRDNGIDLVQGFHLGAPMPASAVPDWLAKHKSR